MLNDHSWTMIRGAALLAVGALLATACGGSAEFTAGAGGAAGDAAGAASSAGKGSGSGGGDACDTVPCIAIGCGPGYKSVRESGSCCPVCEPDGSGGTGGGNVCASASCPAIACVNGTKYQQVPGECCGTCVPDPQACSDGQAGYRALSKQLFTAPGALSCRVDEDCAVLGGDVSCGAGCSSQPVNATAAPGIEQQLNRFATDHCSTCSMIAPPCVPPFQPLCSGGVCILGGYG